MVSFYLIAGNAYTERVEIGGQTRETPFRGGMGDDQDQLYRAFGLFLWRSRTASDEPQLKNKMGRTLGVPGRAGL